MSAPCPECCTWHRTGAPPFLSCGPLVWTVEKERAEMVKELTPDAAIEEAREAIEAPGGALYAVANALLRADAAGCMRGIYLGTGGGRVPPRVLQALQLLDMGLAAAGPHPLRAYVEQARAVLAGGGK